MNASLGAIGRRATVENDDSPVTPIDSFDNHPGSKDIPSSPVSPDINFSEPTHRILRLDEVIKYLRSIDRYLRGGQLSNFEESSTSLNNSSTDECIRDEGFKSYDRLHTICSRRLMAFFYIARRVVQLHVRSTRSETVNSCLLDLSTSVDKITEQEYQRVALSISRVGESCLFNPSPCSKTKMNCVRNICEGLRQGLSLLSRTSLFLTKEFGAHSSGLSEINGDPWKPQMHSLMVMSVLIAASHLVNAGLQLLAFSELTRYTHSELWEITRGMEELSMLTEKVQDQIDARKQIQIRHYLLHLSFNHVEIYQDSRLYELLSQTGLLGDPIDNLRPASVGHIIYLLARYRSLTLAQNLSKHILYFISHEKYANLAKETVRSEYEFCANFLDVMSQSTELLRNLRRAQQMMAINGDTSGNVHGILCKPCLPIVDEEHGNSACFTFNNKMDSKPLRKTVHITKMESIDKFISYSFSENLAKQEIYKPSENLKQFNPMLLRVSIDQNAEERCERKKNIQWSDYCEVSLRHQVVGRYLQLTCAQLSSRFDGGFQTIFPSTLKSCNVISWPTDTYNGILKTVEYINDLNAIENQPTFLRLSVSRQVDQLLSAAHRLEWDRWLNETSCQSKPTQTFLRHAFLPIFVELLKSNSISVDTIRELLPISSSEFKKSIDNEINTRHSFSMRRLHQLLNRCFLSLNSFIARNCSAGLLGNITQDQIGQVFLTTVKRVCSFEKVSAFCSALKSLLCMLIQPITDEGHESTSAPILITLSIGTFEQRFLKRSVTRLSAKSKIIEQQIMELMSFHEDLWNTWKTNYLNDEIIHSQCETVTKTQLICTSLSRVLTQISQIRFSGCPNDVVNTMHDAAALNTPQCISTTVAMVCLSPINAALAYLDAVLSANVGEFHPPALDHFHLLLVKVVTCVDTLSQSDQVKIKERCNSLLKKLLIRIETQHQRSPFSIPKFDESVNDGSSTSTGASNFSNINPKEAISKLHRYLSKNLLEPCNSSTTRTTLETLSLNVRSYFLNEDLKTRTANPSKSSTASQESSGM